MPPLVPGYPRAATACAVCATPLSMVQRARGDRTCGNAHCAWTLQSTPAHARCAVCSRPLATTELVEGACGDSAPSRGECRRIWFIAQHRAAERERQAQIAAVTGALRERTAASLGIDEPAAYPVAVVPSYGRPTTRLPVRRRRAFREHVARQVALAVERGPADDAAASPTPSPDAPLSPVDAATLGAACATCRGFCCRNGGERAYLSAERMQRYMAEHPTLAPDAVIDAYMQHVPQHTTAGSCVYHGPQGCALPREMRSDTCNRFYCGALYDLRRALAADGSRRVFVVAADGRKIEGVAFVDAGVRRGAVVEGERI